MLPDSNISVWALFASGFQDLLPWGSNQPDNWQNNEDCVHLKGMNDHEPGTISDEICTSTKDFICKKGLIHCILSYILSCAVFILRFVVILYLVSP